MLGSIIAVVLGVAAVFVYFKGAKPEKPWGVPVLVLLVIGAVAAVIVPRTNIWRNAMRGRVERYSGMRMAGEALKGELAKGAKVLIIRYGMDPEMMMMEAPPSDGEMPTQEEMLQRQRKQVKRALENGLGSSVEIVGYDAPGLSEQYGDIGQSAEAFNTVLEKYSDKNIDACISMVGLPRSGAGEVELDKLALDNWSPSPLVVADVGLQYDPAILRNYIADGLLYGVVLHPSTRSADQIIVTRENLGDLPEKSPVGPTSGG